MKCYIKDYPRPQFVRTDWENLNGTWDFGFDDENAGEKEKWYQEFKGDKKINVPFTFSKEMWIMDAYYWEVKEREEKREQHVHKKSRQRKAV